MQDRSVWLLGLLLAAPAFGEERAAAPASNPKIERKGPFEATLFDKNIERLRAGVSAYDRATAAQQLGVFRDRKAIEPLIAALDDPDATVRLAAALSLCDLAGPVEIPVMIGLLRHEDPEARKKAGDILREFVFLYHGPSDLDEEQRDTLERWHFWWNEVKAQVAPEVQTQGYVLPPKGLQRKPAPIQQPPFNLVIQKKLDEVAPGQKYPNLKNLLDWLQAPDPQLKIAALRWLADEVGPSPRLGAIHKDFIRSTAERRRWYSNQYRFIPDAPTPEAYIEVREDLGNLLPGVFADLDDPEDHVKIWTMQTLARLAEADAVPKTIEIFKAAQDAHLRGHCAHAWGIFRHKHCLRPLIDALKDPHTFVRDEAIEGLKDTMELLVGRRESFGYRWFDHEGPRAAAIERWEDWYKGFAEREERIQQNLGLVESKSWQEQQTGLFELIKLGAQGLPDVQEAFAKVSEEVAPKEGEALSAMTPDQLKERQERWSYRGRLQRVLEGIEKGMKKPLHAPDYEATRFLEKDAKDPEFEKGFEPGFREK